MRPPVIAVIAASLAVCALAACGSPSAEAPASTATPDAYVAAVQAALVPPGRMASLVVDPATTTVSREEVAGLVDDARARLGALRGLRLGDARLRRQRDAVAGVYDAIVFHMQRVADAHRAGDRAAVIRSSRPFFAALRGLSSAVSPRS